MAGDRLVFDVGMHQGEDTHFYLKRGWKVVGVEANPVLAASLRQRFAGEIAAGDLTIVEKAIAPQSGEVAFYINERKSVWGTIDPVFVERNRRRGLGATAVTVPAITMKELAEQFPEPHYVKIDIEGMDLICLRSLAESSRRPKFLSIESTVSAPINAYLEELELLDSMGYDAFKYVDQSKLAELSGMQLKTEGSPIVYNHVMEGSGPFGEEAPGEWISGAQAATLAEALRRDFERFSKGSNTPLVKVKLNRLLKRLKGGTVLNSWFDLHARRAS